MFDIFDTVTAGSWADWLAATGTSLAFVIAAVSYRRSVNLHRRDQARLVYSKMIDVKYFDPGSRLEILPNGARMGVNGGGVVIQPPASPEEEAQHIALEPVIQATAIIHNGSKELIGPAKVQMVDTGRKRVYDTFSITVGAVDPEADYVVDFVWTNDRHPGQPGLGTTLLFRDASGQWWRRYLAEPIEGVHNDPENDSATPAERAVWAANARAMGEEPSPEPQVNVITRWHRFWRRLNGKPPVP